ncbi:MAG: 2-hydroxyacyl-CoA dehydratase [Bacteroidales bacterium]|nr:2-hydroxyacyl-CoA dehydratase [Bacteroidales bacterium]
MNTTLDKLVQGRNYDSGIEVCPGCDNHCTVRTFRFANGCTFYSGNQCERVYSSQGDSVKKGVNMFAEKNRLLWRRNATLATPHQGTALRIGLPRGLGLYEDFPFWHTLLSECGFQVVLSQGSTNRLYEQGIRTIVADNICFPAKLMHGHVMDLVDKGVDRILYPWVVYERKEDEHSGNSFNCPVVSGYSDVIRSSIDPERRHGIPLDAPVVSFAAPRLLRQSCTDYLATLGVDSRTARRAVEKALAAQEAYLAELERRGAEVLQKAMVEGRMVILLAARPYHIDPLIEHKVSQAIADMGIDVITENVAAHAGSDVYRHINALSQWAYPNRIFKAAWFVGQHPYPALHMVELTSFGCGPDAFILDEVRSILDRHGKNLTTLKIDDVNNIGSLRLRLRSLVESVGEQKIVGVQEEQNIQSALKTPAFTTRPFTADDRRRTILAPYFAEGYSEYLPTLFAMIGYRLENLPMGSHDDAEQGLQEANNDICYPATIVVGSVMRALRSGRYDLSRTAIGMTQTGGQCRASNYYSLIKNALVRAGYADVPVISVAFNDGLTDTQPGFSIPWGKIWRIMLYTMFFADAMQKLYFPAAVREREKGEARRLYDRYTAEAMPLVAASDTRGLMRLLARAVDDFNLAIDPSRQVPQVGLVGEIYVKYNSFSNKNVVAWLMERGVEVVPPALSAFFLSALPAMGTDKELHIGRPQIPAGVSRAANSLIMRLARKVDRICAPFAPYRPFVDAFELQHLSRQVINPAANFGEGWLLPGEICHLAESGIHKVVSVQPFGCIANHIISKGIEKRIKERYPDLSLLFLDFDSGTSEANVQNRLHFMLNQS